MSKPKYTVTGKPYRVRDRYRATGVETWRAVPLTWWEYTIVLRQGRRIVDGFDSIGEDRVKCYTCRGALKKIREITADVKAGKADRWFTVKGG